MIYTVTVNPTLDKTWAVPELRPGEFHRCRVISEDMAGKGINVSQALQLLGIPSKTLGFLGGHTGQVFRDGLTALGLDLDFIEVGGETRQNITLLDEKTGLYTKLNEPGPTAKPEHIDALYRQVETYTQPGDIWVLSGSLPPGAPIDLYAQIIRRAQERGGRAFLDSSGEAMQAGMRARPFGVKPNSDEASEFFGEKIASDDDHVRAVRRLLQTDGTEVAAITRGEDGLVLALKSDSGRVIIARPPAVEAINPVAAGDSAMTGMLWGLLEGCDAVEVARRATAFGTATAMQPGSRLGSRSLIEELIPQIQITAIHR